MNKVEVMMDSVDGRCFSTAPAKTSPVGLENYIRGTTLISSNGPAWKDVFVQVFSRDRNQSAFLVPAVAEPLIVWVMSGDVMVEEREFGGEWAASHVEAGDFFLTRSHTPYEMRWRAEDEQPFRVMHLYLSVSLFDRVTKELFGPTKSADLKDISGGRDEAISHILALFHSALLNDDPADELFVAGLAQSLATHLVRQYAAIGCELHRSSTLPGFKLRRAIALMEAHLDRPFDLRRLARSVGMSEFHFSRLFKKATGLSPSRYFIRQRVAEAQRLLQETDASVIEVGLAVGYSSPSHFAQIFRRETGVSPTDYRTA